MPLSDVGSIVLHHIVFLTHLVYITLAFSHAEPSLVVVLYFISKLVARRPEDIDPASWHPNAAKCLDTFPAASPQSKCRAGPICPLPPPASTDNCPPSASPQSWWL
ncbi:hypothetical protein G6O67_001461 [Ophiocordyceps sinensis]|uniref:Uncharacterized protein n=1 Tax=Ophiocordyceps sinensis TaxID=72228 RepID=A0A8H4PXM4_9HYPO|nr:hypothetical protein G6O67_001461 [Ophiocordyceps sinensis]